MVQGAAKPARDKSERRSNHKDALTQKAYLIAEVAGAIDNEFNNVMMAVTGYAELELKKASPAARRPLEQVLRNSTRATYLVQKLLSLGQNHSSAPQSVNLNEVISGLAEMLRSLLGEQTALVLQLEHGIREIVADPVELEQLLIAMVVHAKQSMPGVQKLYVATKGADLSDNTGSSRSSHAVMISISDSDRAKSLPASSWNAVDDSSADATESILAGIESVAHSAGATCTFGKSNGAKRLAVYFPVPTNDAATPDENEASAATSKTVLIVDDDDSVRLPAVEFLKMEGFKVLQAKTGPEALGIVTQKRSPVDLLITDMVMPSMSGQEVAAKLTEMHAGLKVLYMSGDSGGAARANHIPPKDILHKPFRLDNLNQKIQAVFNVGDKGPHKGHR